MKKNFVILSMIALVAFVAGCKKDNNPTSLPVTIEKYNGGAKVYVNSSNYACWNDGDKARVNGVEATISSTGTGNASIALGTGTPGSPYHAVYPASRVTNYPSAGTYSVTLPDTQHYRVVGGNQIVNGIMAAYGTTHLAFKNLTALVKVTFTNSTSNPITVGSVKVSTTASNQYLSGSGTVTVASSGSHTLSLTSGSQSVSLIGINQNVVAGASATFYVVVPAFEDKAIKVEVLTPNGAYTKSSTSATLASNDMGLLAIASSSPLDANRGVTQGHEWVKIGGIKWATCNIGANSPEEVGYFFSWGNTTGYNLTRITGEAPTSTPFWSFTEANYTGTTGAGLTGNLPATTTNDAARHHWGSSWRIPTRAEMTTLSGACNKSMVTANPYGIQLTSTSNPDLKLFFPSGRAYRNGGINPASLTGGVTEYNGDYWSSTYYSSTYAWCLGFSIHTQTCSQGTGNHIHFDVLSGGARFNGRNIRPVCDL